MKPFILSNRGTQESAHSNEEQVSCDPEFLEILAIEFTNELKAVGMPDEVHLNLVFKGGYICRQYSSLRNKEILKAIGIECMVQSLQLEYDTAITHNQDTLEPNIKNIELLKNAFSKAIEKAHNKYIQLHKLVQ